MQYISELLGAPVHDPDGRVVARVSDVLVAADADYPAFDAVALKPNAATLEREGARAYAPRPGALRY